MSLAKDLWEILGSDSDPDPDYTVRDEQEILDRIEDDLRKSIGDQGYDKLDQYITNNKDDDDLRDLAENVAEETLKDRIFDIMSMDDEDEIKDFIVDLTHDAIKRLYDRLDTNDYDAGKALNS